MAGLNFIFLGPPGSGKGTQATRMAKRFGLVPMSSGDTLRAEVKAGSEVGKKAFEFMQAGTLVPDDIITRVMLAGIDKLDDSAGFILDGFPRTAPQAESLVDGLATAGKSIAAVIDFSLADDLIVDRIVSRRVCKNCGATYNMRFFPPRQEGQCDKCGGEVSQRVDDREDVIKTRLETYRSQTAPLIEFYSQRGMLRSIDAAEPAGTVEASLVGLIESLA